MARMNESLWYCTKVGRWTAHQRIASFPRTPFRTVRATCTIAGTYRDLTGLPTSRMSRVFISQHFIGERYNFNPRCYA